MQFIEYNSACTELHTLLTSTIMQASNSCFAPISSKMSKIKKILAEARESQNREIDLVDQNISALEECPSLSE